MEFDDILYKVGGFGKYQKAMFALVCAVRIGPAFYNMAWVFIAGEPAFVCSSAGRYLSHTDVFATNRNTTNNISSFLEQQVYMKQDSHDNKSRGLQEDNGDVNARFGQCGVYHVTDSNLSSAKVKDDKLLESCDSWIYDKSQYEATIVTEVSNMFDTGKGDRVLKNHYRSFCSFTV